MSALTFNINRPEIFAKLNIPSNVADLITHTIQTTVNISKNAFLSAIEKYNLLKDAPLEAAIFAMAHSLPVDKKFFTDYLFRFRFIKPLITGKDLQSIGIKPGPLYRQIFQGIIEAKIMDKIKTKQEEMEFAKGFKASC